MATTPVQTEEGFTYRDLNKNGRLDPYEDPRRPIDERVEDLLLAWRDCDAVAVTNEVGWGVVPAHASGRLFADLLGRLNQQVAAASDEVWLMVLGRPLAL